jgi:uncharacterized membrane protein YqaE (UPF0057 family)
MGDGMNSFFGLMTVFVLFFINRGLWYMEKWSIILFLFAYVLGSMYCYYTGCFNPIITALLGVEAFLYIAYYNRTI